MHNTFPMQRAISVANAIWDLAAEKLGNDATCARFPRDIETLAIYGLEIPVVRLPVLTLQEADKYLCVLRSDSAQVGREADIRLLYGLLHVGPPANIIFIQENLLPQVVNYIVAHELGHFMSDVLSVRQLWLATMPEQKVAIQRAFNWQDFDARLELAAVIKGLPDRPKTITGRGNNTLSGTTEREVQADLIARELLAPWERASATFRPEPQLQIDLLHEEFGLPWRIATRYYDDLQQCLTPPPDLIDRLFGPLLRTST